MEAGNIQSIHAPCPAGYYCPNGTHYNWQPCPAGTYSNSLMLGKAGQCTACDPGYYCNGERLVLYVLSKQKVYYFMLMLKIAFKLHYGVLRYVLSLNT